jgi:ABC-type sugar transport system ATPase subunit
VNKNKDWPSLVAENFGITIGLEWCNLDSIVSMRGITKSFPGVNALKSVSVDFYPGEIHALMGENGAGKTTLVKVLAGYYTPDEGEIIIKGINVKHETVSEGLEAGISMVHQELSPILDMNVAENIFLGRENVRGPFRIFDRKKMHERTKKLFCDLEINIETKRKMRDLSVAEIQLVEIAKVVSLNSDIVIMDEPTSAISEREVDKLFSILRKLRNEGVAIIYISHKMDEIFQISDKITILRDGEHISTTDASELDPESLITQMVGRELKEKYPKEKVELGDVIFEAKNFSDKHHFRNISFKVRSGEILGISGLMGAGRTELVESIFGLRKAETGKIWIEGKEITIHSPRDAIRNGIALVPEDRKVIGLNLIASVLENISLPSLSNYCRGGFILKNKERQAVDEYITKLNISTPGRYQKVKNLSGGNQQKVVIAKWLLMNAKVVIMDEPTRGIDVGAKVEICRIINSLVKAGKAVIMISSEMPEVIGMSDRIIVLHEGELEGEIYKNEFSQKKIIALASGIEKG